jgi:hypothetical protein
MVDASGREAHAALEEGPPSGDRIALQMEIFSALQEFSGGDPVYREAIRLAFARSHRRPAPICGACDYEFDLGEAPELLYVVRPFEAYRLITGSICGECAALMPDALVRACAFGRAPAGSA